MWNKQQPVAAVSLPGQQQHKKKVEVQQQFFNLLSSQPSWMISVSLLWSIETKTVFIFHFNFGQPTAYSIFDTVVLISKEEARVKFRGKD